MLNKNKLNSVLALMLISTFITGCGDEDIVKEDIAKEVIQSTDDIKKIAEEKIKKAKIIAEEQLKIEEEFKKELKIVIRGIDKYYDITSYYPETDSLLDKEGWNKNGIYISLDITNNWYIQKYDNKIILVLKEGIYSKLKRDFTINEYEKNCIMPEDKNENYCVLLLDKENTPKKKLKKEVKKSMITKDFLDGKPELMTNNINEENFIKELKLIISGLDKYYKETGVMPKTGGLNNLNSQLNNNGTFNNNTNAITKWWLGQFSERIVLEPKATSYLLVTDEYKKKAFKNYCGKSNELQLDVCTLFLKR